MPHMRDVRGGTQSPRGAQGDAPELSPVAHARGHLRYFGAEPREKTITAPSQHEPLNTRGALPECASPNRCAQRYGPINRAQRLRLLAGLILGHLVELVLAICVAHANANTGAHACDGRSRHRCACPRGVERVSTTLRECAPSGLHGTRADTRTAHSTACGRGREEHHPVGAVCASGREGRSARNIKSPPRAPRMVPYASLRTVFSMLVSHSSATCHRRG